MPGLCVKFTRNLIYIFIIISLAGFIYPSYSLTKSNGLSSSQISAQATVAKKAAARAVAKANAAKKAAARAVAKANAAKKAVAKTTTAKKTAAKKTTAKKNGSPLSHVNINPLRDLGIDKGYICFRIKAYSNTEISKFSKPACTYRKNSKNFKLAWAKGPSSVIGYQVYFGDSAKKTETFLADVL